MVKSLLKDLNYPEIRAIDEEDKNMMSSIYECELFGFKVYISLGQAKHEFNKKDIIYYPIYLISKQVDGVVSRIGLYEISTTKASDITDYDGDVDIDALGDARLFSFVTKGLIEKNKQPDIELTENVVKNMVRQLLDSYDYDDLINIRYRDLKDKLLTTTDLNENSYETFKDVIKDEIRDYYHNKSESKEAKEQGDEAEQGDDEVEQGDDEAEQGDDEVEQSDDEVEQGDDEVEQGDEALRVKPTSASILPEQTAEMARAEKSEYIERVDDVWIKKFFKNSNYEIVQNEGGGDCLFLSIKDGLKTVGKDVSVLEMRELLSSKVTSEIFNEYKTIYDGITNTIRNTKGEVKIIAGEHNNLVRKYNDANNIDSNILNTIKQEIIDTKKRHEQRKKELKASKEMLKEFEHMKDVETLDDFKAVILTKDFWADTWAISTIEENMNIKLIIFDKGNFDSGDLNNVMQCGQLNDNTQESFEPNYYIPVNYLGNHYELITYKGYGAMKFKEIPYDIKMEVVGKCLEREAGPYHRIPEFKNFLNEVNVEMPEVLVEVSPELYDDKTIFQFSSRSNGKKKAGKGAGEKISNDDVNSFTELNGIEDWRRKLDNDWFEEISIDGKRWGSVSHYLYAVPFRKYHPLFYQEFSMDSKSAISKDLKLAKEASQKRQTNLRAKEIVADPEFSQDDKSNEENKALQVKFTENDEFKRLLKATKRAMLQEKNVPKSPAIVRNDLMRIRNNL